MPNQFTEVTSRSWGSRLGGSIKGIFFGFILFLGSFFLLFWNEGNAVRTTQANEEGAAIVVSLPEPKVNSTNEGKLVHITGTASTTETLSDPEFGIKVTALKLIRDVEIYQWKETEESKTEKKTGGGEETKTTYKYDMVWSKGPIDSQNFRYPEGHTNTRSANYEYSALIANEVLVGDFHLSPTLLEQISKSEILPLDQSIKAPQGGAVKNNYMYFGSKNEMSPQIGDVKVHFEVVNPVEVSIVAKQALSSLEPYIAHSGKELELLEYGNITAPKMFEMAETRNTIITWAIRGGGFLLMFIGLTMIFKPLSVLGDVVPFVGNVLNAGIGLVSGIISFALSLITIAVAWFFYRPLLGASLAVIAIGSIILVRKRMKNKKLQTVKQPPVEETIKLN